MISLKQTDISQVVASYNSNDSIHHRYKSFDFCYAHFHPQSKGKNDNDLEKSCYVLWGYLASWGMLRGSSHLLNLNPAYLKPLVKFINKQKESLWDIDVPNYPKNFETITDLYNRVTEKLNWNDKRHVTLVTKIILGVFGIVPAYDQNFRNTFKCITSCGFSSFNKKSLDTIYRFYVENQMDIDNLHMQCVVVDFEGNSTLIKYPRAKIIDMYGFQRAETHR
ncbi:MULTISPECIES: hypothetical protein [Neisseria]|uniref:Uncharacterized protein n=1 Tax=Neisseria weaveri TaxID=28091 RepID=A0A3S5B3K7_9NEIS|nr:MULTISPECIES: hypothetical protein [Neisseria]VEJ50384.1 Uncharacterised protein [Neisseria weaveri]